MKNSTSYKRAEMPKGTSSVLDLRTLENSNANLPEVLKKGQSVLDVGCGSGSITKDIINYVGSEGKVTGIDRSQDLIDLANENYKEVSNLSFLVGDILEFNTPEKWDVITIARTLQWIENPKEIIDKLVTLLKPQGIICVLDYNHNLIEWSPSPPQSMIHFYTAFLNWRSDCGMDNGIGDTVQNLFKDYAVKQITVSDQSEFVERGMSNFEQQISIWQKVAKTRGNQLVADNYITEEERIAAIEEYATWYKDSAKSMKLYLKATHIYFN